MRIGMIRRCWYYCVGSVIIDNPSASLLGKWWMVVGPVNNPLCSPNIGAAGREYVRRPQDKISWKNFLLQQQRIYGLVEIYSATNRALAAKSVSCCWDFKCLREVPPSCFASHHQAFKVLLLVTLTNGLAGLKMGKSESEPGSISFSKLCFSCLLGLFRVFWPGEI